MSSPISIFLNDIISAYMYKILLIAQLICFLTFLLFQAISDSDAHFLCFHTEI